MIKSSSEQVVSNTRPTQGGIKGKVTNIEYGKIDFENDIIETVTSTPF